MIHYTYFICTILVTAIILWGASTPPRGLRFIDALFLTTSAMTLAGLNTVNLSTLNTFQQFLLFLLIMLGSAILVSSVVVLFRRQAFERKFKKMADLQSSLDHGLNNRTLPVQSDPAVRHGRVQEDTDLESHGRPHTSTSQAEQEAGDVPNDQAPAVVSPRPDGTMISEKSRSPGNPRTIAFDPDVNFGTSNQHAEEGSSRSMRRRTSYVSARGVGAHPNAQIRSSRPWNQTSDGQGNDGLSFEDSRADKPVFSWVVGRNSGFSGLSKENRKRLSTVEYRALIWLSWIVPLYYILMQLFGCIGLGAWVANNRPDTTRRNGINPYWLGAFNAVSAFNNSGMSVLDLNMTVFQDGYYMLLTMGFLILAGNTCYPIFLRLIIWTIWKLLPQTERFMEHKTTLRFLLDHPRRCYTNLFPSRHTWWLLSAVVVLNSIDWAAFEILNIGNERLTNLLPVNLRVIDGLFQAFAVRSGGFYVVPIPILRISLQILYVVMMYISVYPVVITLRNSNVYEERSLGIYAEDPTYQEYQRGTKQPRSIWQKISGLPSQVSSLHESKSYFVRQQMRAQLAHDIWWLVLAVFLIMIIEGGRFERDPATFSVFNVMFETVSAYGTVGISIGVPYDNYSFCGAWTTTSKLILCAVMIRGRHRGLPVAIDRAILLPGERLADAEEEDAMIRMERSASRGRTATAT